MGMFKRQLTPVQLTDAEIVLAMLCVENEEQRIADGIENLPDTDVTNATKRYSADITALYHTIDRQR